MRVNSFFTSFFNKRLVPSFGITIVIIAIFFTASSFKKHSDSDLRIKQVNLIIRQIGHRLLLQAGDLTSRVLPVTEDKEGTFLLQFENEFVFNHDSLIVLSQSLLPKTQFPSGYTVTVHDCMKGDIVYGFQINNTSPDILACSGRSQPAGCYTIEFDFPDLYENNNQKKADTDQQTEEFISAKEVNTIPITIGTDQLRKTTVDYNVDHRTEVLKSVKVDSKEVNTIPIAIGTDELKKTTSNYPLINLVYGGMLLLLGAGITLLIGHYKKNFKPLPAHNQNHAITKESIPEFATLGKFLFDVKRQHLLLGSGVISLTDKECKVLKLLNNNFGELITRDTLMQEVWINEGVFTGRSLDMFISKLRKKLSLDPELRITNVHGKGYKLEIPEIQI